MNRGTGTGLIAFGVVLGVVGAIMAFAITVNTRGFNINTVTGSCSSWGSSSC
jgi:hypothetical protein